MAIEQGRTSTWRKSSYSVGNSECVEVASPSHETVAVRDSKDPHGPVLTFSPESWTAFVSKVNQGVFQVG
jgi:hypothetical protein